MLEHSTNDRVAATKGMELRGKLKGERGASIIRVHV